MKNLTLSIDDKLLERARERLRATGKTVNQEFREHLERIAGADVQLEAEVEAFLKRAGQGHSNGWKWNRDEIYKEMLDERGEK